MKTFVHPLILIFYYNVVILTPLLRLNCDVISNISLSSSISNISGGVFIVIPSDGNGDVNE